MNQRPSHIGVMPHAWLQHHVPWLALFSLVIGLFAEDADAEADVDDLNG